MERIEAFLTADGQLFESERAAIAHAEQRYSEALLPLAHAICQFDKYAQCAAWIDANLDALAALRDLKQDITINN